MLHLGDLPVGAANHGPKPQTVLLLPDMGQDPTSHCFLSAPVFGDWQSPVPGRRRGLNPGGGVSGAHHLHPIIQRMRVKYLCREGSLRTEFP